MSHLSVDWKHYWLVTGHLQLQTLPTAHCINQALAVWTILIQNFPNNEMSRHPAEMLATMLFKIKLIIIGFMLTSDDSHDA